MKLIKMFGLTALAALMAMAFLGASSAMAEGTQLCTADASPEEAETAEACVEAGGTPITHVHEVTAKGAPAILKTSISTVKCEVLFLGDALEEGSGEPLLLHGHFTYVCEGGCTAKETSADSLIEVLRLGHELADITGKGEVKVICGGINCTYKGEGLKGHGLGPLLTTAENGQISIEEQTINKVGGLFCPKTAELSILTTPLEKTYLSDEPAPIYIESCMSEEGTECKIASAGTTFNATSESFIIETKEKKEGEELNEDECSVALSGKVIDPSSEGTGDELELSITKYEIAKCTGASLSAGSLPWIAKVDASQFAIYHEIPTESLITTPDPCPFTKVVPEDEMFLNFDAGTMRWSQLGSLKKEPSGMCQSLLDLRMGFNITEISDPNLGGASVLRLS